jgi:6-phosphogluconolactonase (cycloisomerase 2 family)
VYVLNNNLVGPNSITVFNRASNGSLTQVATVPIGGVGSGKDFKSGSQGSLIITPQATRLFAVDAGSNQISVVNVLQGHLTLAAVFASGGVSPISLTYRSGLLYVLNAAIGSTKAANVAGFHVDSNGFLHRIAGATRPLSTAHPDPAQVQIDPLGRFLLVTEKATNLIDVYPINSDGSLGGLTTFSSVGATPFGMAFKPASTQDEFIVSDAAGGPNGTGAASAYSLTNGSIGLINGPVADHLKAPCWMVVTHNGLFAYTSNADSHAISGYGIQGNGTISLLNSNGVTATTPSDTFPIEEALSSASQLYVLDTRVMLMPPGPATLSGFLIHSNGSLTSVVNSAQITLPVSAVGLAAD